MLGMISTAHAYTAEQSGELPHSPMLSASACSEIPDVDRVTACMVQHKAELSPGCKSVFAAPRGNRRPAPPPDARSDHDAG